jgi:hypothetical protein
MLQNKYRSWLVLISAWSVVAAIALWGLGAVTANAEGIAAVLFFLANLALWIAPLSAIGYLVSASVGMDSAEVIKALRESRDSSGSGS